MRVIVEIAYKDIFDMYYLTDYLDSTKLKECINIFILDDSGMREETLKDPFHLVKAYNINKIQ